MGCRLHDIQLRDSGSHHLVHRGVLFEQLPAAFGLEYPVGSLEAISKAGFVYSHPKSQFSPVVKSKVPPSYAIVTERNAPLGVSAETV